MKKTGKFISILIIGGIGGILSCQFLLPYLSHIQLFSKISWLKQINNGTTIINKTEEKIIREDTALEDAIAKISPAVVGIISKNRQAIIKTKKQAPENIIYGSGFIITSDGLIVAATSTAPEKDFDYFVVKDNENLPAEIVKRDDKIGLILLKIQKTNLPVVAFSDLDNLRLGERVVLLGFDAALDPTVRFADFGIIKSLMNKSFTVSIKSEEQKASGAPLIDIEGAVAGMVIIDRDSQLKIISAEQIKKFLSQ